MRSVILSYALDTNGQNYRYMKASQKWGHDPDVLKALAIGDYDPAAVVARFQDAARDSDELVIRSVHRSAHIYQSMPSDIMWEHRTESLVRNLARGADIWHLNNSWRPLQRLKIGYDKPILLHHHGSLLRQQYKDLLNWAYRHNAVQAVSTVDLMRYSPELHWLPTAYDVDWLQEFGREHRGAPRRATRVVSAPTNRTYKSTDALEVAVAQLQRDGLDVELVIIEGMPWLDAMQIKATADIYFDQVAYDIGDKHYPGGYGCNAIEAWGMGIPVIAGADEWTSQKMREVYGSQHLPFYEATPATIGAAIADLATHKRKRTTYAKRGYDHIRRFHDEKPALVRLAELYRMAIDRYRPGQVIPIEPVTFAGTVPQILIGGKRITFSVGPYTTDSEPMIRQIRMLALRKPHYGIRELDSAASLESAR